MSLPTLSHLQCAVLDELGAAEMSGRDLRAALRARGISKSGPGFYQLMARLEDSDLVEGRYEEKTVAGQRIRERKYKLTGLGATMMSQTLFFYAGMKGGTHAAI